MASRLLSRSLVLQRYFFRTVYPCYSTSSSSLSVSAGGQIQSWFGDPFKERFSVSFDILHKRISESQLRWYSSSSSSESPNASKPLHEWTSEEVDNWIKAKFPALVYENERTKKRVSIFSLVAGKELSIMTEGKIQALIDRHIVNYKTLPSETGALAEPLYLAIQDLKQRFSSNPWTVVSALEKKLKKAPHEAKSITTEFFPFTGREKEKELLIECFEKSGELWAGKETTDKKKWVVPLVCGGSGYGKTRFALQTKEFLLQHTFHNPKVASAVCHAEQYVFPLKPNGNQLSSIDSEMGPDVYLGLRLLHGRTAPRIPWVVFRSAFLEEVPKPDSKTFSLANVLSKFPCSSEEQTIILVVDEFQESSKDQFITTHHGGKEGVTEERFSNALYRELMGAMTTPLREGLFVFPILVGTALSSDDLALQSTDFNRPTPILMGGFLQSDTNHLVTHFKNGDLLLKDNRFQRLLAMLGGVGRPLERLKEILDEYEPPVNDWSSIRKKLDLQLRDLYVDGQDWKGYLGTFMLLLQGYPVMKETRLPHLEGKRGNAEEMESFLKRGLVSSYSLETTEVSSLKAPQSRDFSPQEYYLLGAKPLSPRSESHFLMSAPICYLLLPRIPPLDEHHWILSTAHTILRRLDLFSFSFLDFEDLAVLQFFLRFLVSSWMASNEKKDYIQGSQLLFGTKPHSNTSPPVFQKKFALASPGGVLDLAPYHREYKFKPTGPDPFYPPGREKQPYDLSDPTISFVALRLGGKSTFDGVLMVRDSDDPTLRTFFWIDATHVSSQGEDRVGQDKTDSLIDKSKRVKVEGNDVHYIVTVTNSAFRQNSTNKESLAGMDNLFLVDKTVLDLYFSPSVGLALKYYKF